MSNVYSNASFAVMSVMHSRARDNLEHWVGSTCFIQRKPEDNYGQITVQSFSLGNPYNLEKLDFDVQARFDANVAPTIQNLLTDHVTGNVAVSNSNISVVSMKADGTVITP